MLPPVRQAVRQRAAVAAGSQPALHAARHHQSLSSDVRGVWRHQECHRCRHVLRGPQPPQQRAALVQFFELWAGHQRRRKLRAGRASRQTRMRLGGDQHSGEKGRRPREEQGGSPNISDLRQQHPMPQSPTPQRPPASRADLCGHYAWGYAVDPNAIWPQLLSQRLGQPQQRSLAHSIPAAEGRGRAGRAATQKWLVRAVNWQAGEQLHSSPGRPSAGQQEQ